jgi:AmiR/NasT family two-component response regulator
VRRDPDLPRAVAQVEDGDVAALVERVNQLQTALDSRIVIEQAKGMLAAWHELPLDRAFEVLRRGARSHQLRIHDLARRVVEERRTPPEIAKFI